ncbi:4-alpha-glucanotransferase [Neptunicella marina]|uniref:4-alpha-glucanotransferase n=1 Tax=Neptunicella marina TaxID=2125989 RepID=A0A8J6IY93_9ALTE|nr:4-alpha-glucanotransferase [Neptunicella marina]MBC3767358.1 4-alpha-glucanotransferase [Neptunicella marina]
MGIDKLLYLQGVGAQFIDCFGQTIQIPHVDRLGILHSMLDQKQLPQSLSDEFIHQRNTQLDATPWTKILPQFQWCYDDDLSVSLHLPELDTEHHQLIIETENRQQFQLEFCSCDLNVTGDYRIGDRLYFRYKLELKQYLTQQQLDQISLGYHKVAIGGLGGVGGDYAHWVVAPHQVYQFNQQGISLNEQHSWGVNIQLFTLRSQSVWKIGDFGDLNHLINWIAPYGADFILLNPLHALDISDPENASPYSPLDRRRLNPLYIQIEKVPEFKILSDTALKRAHAKMTKRSKLSVNDKEDNWLDYTVIFAAKYQVFTELFKQFQKQHLRFNTPRAKRFHRFLKEQGESLLQFATREMQRAPQLKQQVEFFCYLQFVANQQLQDCQKNALRRGMAIGLIRDLAVGAVADGEEIQQNAGQFCLNASIGAPPDPIAPQGQNWQLTPLDPVKLKQHDYSHFIALIRSNMQHSGALRMDHIMSLMRLWWWPKDHNNGNGAYVYYPFDTLLALLCLESQRAKCMVIGEDLGVVPPEIVSSLYQAGIISNELFYFCRHQEAFKAPDEHKRQSMMMLSNHDVPTLAAWWSGFDIELRDSLALYPNEQEKLAALTQRKIEKEQVINYLQYFNHDNQVDNQRELSSEEIVQKLAPVVARSASVMFSLPLSDLCCDKHPVNIPGTWKEYPNWRRRIAKSIQQMKKDSALDKLLKDIAAARSDNG